ncbi:MAG: cation:proton antiporter, partial [Eudoraea sp.]|nr:cation:proton antiporter [Eudoraea sp.]
TGLSGVLALVVSGLIINYRSRKYGGLGRVSYEMLENLWEFIGFLSSSIAFIFIGMNLDRDVFSVNFSTSLIVFLLLLLFRKVMVELISRLTGILWSKDFPSTWRNGFTWAGLRGAVSVVLALGVSGLVPNSEYIIAITFGVVILSNFVQGTTMGTLINRWELGSMDHSIEGWDNIFSLDYVDSGYRPDNSLFERVFFSAPEYFIRDTSFGTWLAGLVISAIGYINTYEVDSIQKRTIGTMQKVLIRFRDVLLALLAWINENFLKRDESR